MKLLIIVLNSFILQNKMVKIISTNKIEQTLPFQYNCITTHRRQKDAKIQKSTAFEFLWYAGSDVKLLKNKARPINSILHKPYLCLLR